MASKKAKQGILSKWVVGDEKPVKIDKWDSSAVKNALDDAVRKVFTNHFKFVEDHKIVDRRLMICTVACLFAVAALAFDYFNPFPNSRPVLILCVFLYFMLMAVLTAFTTFKEKNYFVFVMEKDKAGMGPDNVLDARSTLKRYDEKYELTISFEHGETKEKDEQTITKSVANWFDENGVLLFEEFSNDVKEMINNLKKEKTL